MIREFSFLVDPFKSEKEQINKNLHSELLFSIEPYLLFSYNRTNYNRRPKLIEFGQYEQVTPFPILEITMQNIYNTGIVNIKYGNFYNTRKSYHNSACSGF